MPHSRQLNNYADAAANTASAAVAKNVLGSTASSIDFSQLGFGGQAANGGFFIYPNKPNTNTMQDVYKK